MKVTYLKLENVAGLVVGSGLDTLEIDFNKSINKIIALVGKNASGKTVLLSSIQPFATPGNIDERSTLSYIVEHRNGYKEIRYQDNGDEYIIKHYFKASKDTHSVKSYFCKNGEELNENGNVTSFNSLVEIHFGLTQEMLRLVRIGTNVDSFISLTPARRKEYVGKLIEEIDVYMKIYKKINEDIRIIKAMMQVNTSNLYNCHITDITVEEDKLHSLRKDIDRYQVERDEIVGQLGKINNLIGNTDVNDLRKKRHEIELMLKELDSMDAEIKENGLTGVTTDELVSKRNKLSDSKIDVQSTINSYRLSIDQLLSNIDKIETTIKKNVSNTDVIALHNAITTLTEEIKNTPKYVLSMDDPGVTSDALYDVLTKLQSFNKISNVIQTFGNTAIHVYTGLRRSNKSVEKWLKEQLSQRNQALNYADVSKLMERIFADDDIIEPNCVSEFAECPFYRLYSVIGDIKEKLEDRSYDDETLNYVSIISRNFDSMLNDIDMIVDTVRLPDIIREGLSEIRMMERMEMHLPLFEIDPLSDYLTTVKEYELYHANINRLHDLEQRLSLYKQSGVEGNMAEIENLQNKIEYLKSEIVKLTSSLSTVTSSLATVDRHIALVTKYNENIKYRKSFVSTLESTNKMLEPLENAAQQKSELDFRLRNIDNIIASLNDDVKSLELKIAEYRRLLKESKNLAKKNKDLNIILDAVSTKKGIPLYYMKKYLTRIQRLSNELLRMIYNDEFQLAPFNVTPETFEVPYVKNGRMISDIKYASQSEISLSTMALSFALATNASSKYNILLLDEIDAGLDDVTRSLFLKMLYMQIERINAQQVFIISHNLSQMTNVPMDCICFSDMELKSKLQNIIFEV